MIELTGSIVAIVAEMINGRDKRIMTLDVGKDNLAYIEFQGKFMVRIVDNYRSGDKVKVVVVFRGNKSKIGRHYNNIICKSIELI